MITYKVYRGGNTAPKTIDDSRLFLLINRLCMYCDFKMKRVEDAIYLYQYEKWTALILPVKG